MFIDWPGLVLSVLKTIRKEDQKIDPKYIAIKPRILSDHNILRGVAALRAVLVFIPPAAIASPVLSLGEVGFNIWKRIALSGEYDSLLYPPLDPNLMRIKFEMDEELNKHYGNLIVNDNWNPETIAQLEVIHNDFSFITSEELLRSKYPHIDPNYITNVCDQNRNLLNESIHEIEQEITKVSQKSEVDTNLRDALEALKVLFPAMRDWALFNSEGFDEIMEILDTLF